MKKRMKPLEELLDKLEEAASKNTRMLPSRMITAIKKSSRIGKEHSAGMHFILFLKIWGLSIPLRVIQKLKAYRLGKSI